MSVRYRGGLSSDTVKNDSVAPANWPVRKMIVHRRPLRWPL